VPAGAACSATPEASATCKGAHRPRAQSAVQFGSVGARIAGRAWQAVERKQAAIRCWAQHAVVADGRGRGTGRCGHDWGSG
jgi:hypothetical protein